jgi:hypothetical protein
MYPGTAKQQHKYEKVTIITTISGWSIVHKEYTQLPQQSIGYGENKVSL